MDETYQQNLNTLRQFLNDTNVTMEQKLQYIKECDQAKNCLSILANHVQNYKRNLRNEQIISSNNNSPANYTENDRTLFSPTNNEQFILFPSIDENFQSFNEDNLFNDAPRDDSINNNINNINNNSVGTNQNSLTQTSQLSSNGTDPNNPTSNLVDEKQKFPSEDYKPVIDFLDLLVHNIEGYIETWKPEQLNVSKFRDFLVARTEISMIKEGIQVIKDRMDNANAYSAIEYIKLGYFFATLKMEAYSEDKGSYINYINDTLGQKFDDSKIQRCIKMYCLFYRMNAVILAIYHGKTNSYNLFGPFGTKLMNVLDIQGRRWHSIVEREIPLELLESLPPMKAELKDAYKDQNKRKRRKKNLK